jgi:hypothetical protein
MNATRVGAGVLLESKSTSPASQWAGRRKRHNVSEFIVIPDTFLKYVTEFRRIPIPVDTDIETLRAIVETVCLEASLGSEEVQPDLESPRNGAVSDR